MLTHIDKEIYVNADLVFKEDVIINSRDFIDFINKESDVIIYGEQDLSSSNILSKLLQNRGSTKIARQTRKFTKEDIDENNPYQLFFLDVEDKSQREKSEKEVKYLVAFKDNYETVFKKFKSEPSFRVDKNRNIKKYKSVQPFRSWEQILPNLPITEIVISDPFIIMKQTEAKREKNLYGLFAAIKSKYNIKSILVFTRIKDDHELKEIEEKAQQIFGTETICNFIEFPEREGEHDRHIFTNYKHISLGSSANYFGRTSNKTSNIHTFSYYKKQHQQEALIILDSLKLELKNSQLKDGLSTFIKNRLLDYKEKTMN
ncbi:MAG: hypothetical protein EOM83_14215 [Clostridia bacterium]|nr:hypothetical protein [Clostridia bacterium]